MLLDRWLEFREYIPEEELRQALKIYNRQYNQYNKIKTMLKNNLIVLLDQTFSGVNKIFSSPVRKSGGHEKWVDFALKFWHAECVCGISERVFTDKYRRGCSKTVSYRVKFVTRLPTNTLSGERMSSSIWGTVKYISQN